MKTRNLFRIRTAEHFDENAQFLRLFGPSALDFFKPDEMWQKIQIIRSARGGGKTSILRIFSPKSLLEIASHSEDREIAPLYRKLSDLGVFGHGGSVQVLGVPLSMFSNYPVLEQLGLDVTRQNMLFYSMLASKMTVATLRSVCELRRLGFPEGLDEIEVGRPDDPHVPVGIPVPCTGRELYNWASETERSIHSSLESGADACPCRAGHETLSVVRVLQSGNILHGGRPVAQRTLIMLDDVDKLTRTQRTNLFCGLADLRIPGIWIAERLEALQSDELLAPNGTLGREYGQPVMLERFWRSNPPRFAALLRAISSRRAEAFEGHLCRTLDSDPSVSLEAVRDKARGDVVARFRKKAKYRDLIIAADYPRSPLGPLDSAINWRALRLAMERDSRRRQTTLTGEPLPVYNIDGSASSLKSVSKYLLCAENSLPYCYGFEDLASLASSNIQQFLGLASDILDEMMAAKTLGRGEDITATRQYAILCAAADRRWDEIVKTVHCDGLVNFLDNMAKFCKDQTGREGSPYQTVTGVAISAASLQRLQSRHEGENPRYDAIANVLSTAFAHNILEPNPDVSQGARGSKHLVIYLNRLLCLKYRLPLPYGGWREKTLESMCSLLDARQRNSGRVSIQPALEVTAR